MVFAPEPPFFSSSSFSFLHFLLRTTDSKQFTGENIAMINAFYVTRRIFFLSFCKLKTNFDPRRHTNTQQQFANLMMTNFRQIPSGAQREAIKNRMLDTTKITHISFLYSLLASFALSCFSFSPSYSLSHISLSSVGCDATLIVSFTVFFPLWESQSNFYHLKTQKESSRFLSFSVLTQVVLQSMSTYLLTTPNEINKKLNIAMCVP